MDFWFKNTYIEAKLMAIIKIEDILNDIQNWNYQNDFSPDH